jgi:signal peptidase I
MKIVLQALGQILKITLTILLFITLPAVVFTLITSKTPIVNGIQSFVVLTGSMNPSIPVGSIIYTIPSSIYKVGDVITFKDNSLTVTHRVVDVTKEGYKTRGDANTAIDSKVVTKEQIIGKRVFSVQNAGKLILAMKAPQGFIAFLVIPILLFMGFEFWNIKKEWEKSIRKKLIKQLNLERDLDYFKKIGQGKNLNIE